MHDALEFIVNGGQFVQVYWIELAESLLTFDERMWIEWSGDLENWGNKMQPTF